MRTDHDADSCVLDLRDVDRTQVALVGGKGAHLGELTRIDGVRVPAGFCVTTGAFRRIVTAAPSIQDRLDRLSGLRLDDREPIRALSAEVRQILEATPVPQDLAAAIIGAVTRLGERTACAVRSSATAEDLPTASFAGQQDTYLNVVGAAAVLQHVRRCWASLFTERAVTYRLRNGVDHRTVHMAVVVQEMVAPDAAGVLFTADPVTGNRRVASVEASFGLGEALVSGVVEPDVWAVRAGEVVRRAIASKPLAIRPSAAGGTEQRAVEPARQEEPALTDAQVLQLVQLGRRIEAHLSSPQDIEWCLADDGFHVVQSRPITTLFPIPDVDDGADHVWVSVGHQQMMTDAMKALGLSVWLLTAARPMDVAGGRLFVDVTDLLATPSSRDAIVGGFGRADPLIGDALQTVVDRGFVPSRPDEAPGVPHGFRPAGPVDPDPAVVPALIEENRASVAALEREIRTRSGAARLDFILEDVQEMKRILFDPRSHAVIMAGMEALWWLNERLEEWLGERNAADALTRSVPHNVTSEMGLALLDVADAVRPHPQVVAFLADVDADADDERVLDELPRLVGGEEARAAIRAYLDEYGMRCVGEIDITRPRWSERPAALVPAILGNVRAFQPGEAARRFDQGRREAEARAQELLERLRALPDGQQKAEEAERVIERVRAFAGYREYPKYGMVRRYAIYKRALLEEAERLVQAHVLERAEDIFHLTFEELHDVVRTQRVDDGLIRRRQEELRAFQALVPPRVLTSEGEAVAGAYRRDDLPPGALVGLPVSAGTVEGRARVVVDMADAELEVGDILVTTSTDPSWSPLFVAVSGLVTEVGGLMTHGAAIAREYGLPAVVGVQHATRLIPDGRRIRVDGTRGAVEVLEAAATPG